MLSARRNNTGVTLKGVARMENFDPLVNTWRSGVDYLDEVDEHIVNNSWLFPPRMWRLVWLLVLLLVPMIKR